MAVSQVTNPFQAALQAPPRQPITGRLPRNPIDKCTIVSIFPKHIVEVKHTIEPGRFEIPAGSVESPSLLVVGSSSWWINRGDDQPTLEIPVFSISIAESIIRDYCNGLVACDMVDRIPGLFFVEGERNLEFIRANCADMIKSAAVKQKEWYLALVRLADSLWARSNGNPLAIPDESRVAAKELKYDDKPWLLDFKMAAQESCFACGSLKNPMFPVCPVCRAIDPNNPASKDIKFAG